MNQDPIFVEILGFKPSDIDTKKIVIIHTMRQTNDEVKATRQVFSQDGRKGSGFLVTGLILTENKIFRFIKSSIFQRIINWLPFSFDSSFVFWPRLLFLLEIWEVPFPTNHSLSPLPEFQKHCCWGKKIEKKYKWNFKKTRVILIDT